MVKILGEIADQLNVEMLKRHITAMVESEV
jgi:hypothetical protein